MQLKSHLRWALYVPKDYASLGNGRNGKMSNLRRFGLCFSRAMHGAYQHMVTDKRREGAHPFLN